LRAFSVGGPRTTGNEGDGMRCVAFGS
jgi:hypothetical protein